MKLNNLIEGLTMQQIAGSTSKEIFGITFNSKEVEPGFLFAAIKGAIHNGHDFIPEAIRRGAKAIISETIPATRPEATWITVPDTRIALAQVAATFLNNPSLALKVVGITGTNGKTTTTYLLESIFRAAGHNPGVIGTINYRFGNIVKQSLNTTPESLEIQKLLAHMVKEKVSHVAMEVSSHALDQNRVEGINFAVGVFTNLTPEHLDYHGTMEDYTRSKTKLFSRFLEHSKIPGEKFAVLNQDDLQTSYIRSRTSVSVVRYGMGNGVDITVQDAKVSHEGIRGTLKTPHGSIEVTSSLFGRFNLYNIMAATGAALCLHIPLEAIRSGIENFISVPGRMERVGRDSNFTILVDYAHTPDALEKALFSLRELAPKKIITVFGCGGDRDRHKRPMMGEIAATLSDLVVITSDNPRTEKPEAIIAEIEEGVKNVGLEKISPNESLFRKGYCTVEDRFEAIRVALGMAQPGDSVLVAGKGHEDYQIIGTQKIHFDDREKIREALDKVKS
jgi:UDP-N-acetylmuramoyl-L-alanyl-D-glutamate--2,6-diaminopimelate ligase